jgi:RNA polymerase sigma factor (sigma-70 family)
LNEDEIRNLLTLVERTARTLSRSKGLFPQDSDDFVQDALVKFIENDYAVYRKFRNEAQLPTYVTSVLSRMLIDRVIAERGKFRPSPAALELGEVATLLERYVYRDGLSFSVACEKLRTDHGVTLSDAELETLFGKLPRRYRREIVSADSVEHLAARDSAEDNVSEDQRLKRNTRVAEIIEQCKTRVSSQDALILGYWQQGVRVIEIAKILGIQDKRVYDRIAALKKLLKQLLEENGIKGSDI